MNLNLHIDYQILYIKYGDYSCDLAVKAYKQVPIDEFFNKIFDGIHGIRLRNFNIYPLSHKFSQIEESQWLLELSEATQAAYDQALPANEAYETVEKMEKKVIEEEVLKQKAMLSKITELKQKMQLDLFKLEEELKQEEDLQKNKGMLENDSTNNMAFEEVPVEELPDVGHEILKQDATPQVDNNEIIDSEASTTIEETPETSITNTGITSEVKGKTDIQPSVVNVVDAEKKTIEKKIETNSSIEIIDAASTPISIENKYIESPMVNNNSLTEKISIETTTIEKKASETQANILENKPPECPLKIRDTPKPSPKSFFGKIWDKVKNIAARIFDGIKSLFKSIFKWLKPKPKKIVHSKISNFMSAIEG